MGRCGCGDGWTLLYVYFSFSGKCLIFYSQLSFSTTQHYLMLWHLASPQQLHYNATYLPKCCNFEAHAQYLTWVFQFYTTSYFHNSVSAAVFTTQHLSESYLFFEDLPIKCDQLKKYDVFLYVKLPNGNKSGFASSTYNMKNAAYTAKHQ